MTACSSHAVEQSVNIAIDTGQKCHDNEMNITLPVDQVRG